MVKEKMQEEEKKCNKYSVTEPHDEKNIETDNKHGKYFFIGKDEVQDLGKELFAHFTARTRFRKIFSEHCSGDYEADFLNKSICDALAIGSLDNKDSCELFTESGLKNFLDTVNEKIRNPYHDYSVPTMKKQNNEKESHSQGKLGATEKEQNKKTTLSQENSVQTDEKACEGSTSPTLNESSTLKEFFDNAPFFEAEVLFYHALLAQKKYFSNHYDFFATEKKDSLLNSQAKFIENLNSLFTSETKDKEEKEKLDKNTFHDCIKYCLSANTSDLSQLNSKERFGYEVGDIRIMYDDTDVLYEYLSANKKFKRFDIICDNAGKELFSDLYLACYFLHNKIVDKVVFHLKPYPFFVSDATKEDFGFMMNAIMQYGGTECDTRCNEYILNGNIEIEDNKFWATPLCFKDMPKNKLYEELYKQLCGSDLIIVKGDLNYRRLVEDRDWNYTVSFAKRTQTVFGRAPIFAPRVIKSDVLIGISEAAYETARSSDKHGASADQRFKGNGKWAVVHFRCDKYEQYKKKAQERNNPQIKPNGSDDNKTEEKRQPAKNSSEQQDEKNPNNGKKNIFYITVNVCYILATVLILAMLVTSTIPVIAQTISIAHENSSLTKKQETEQIQEEQKNLPHTIFANAVPPEQTKTERPVTASADSNLSEQVEAKQPAKTAELKYGDVSGRIDFTLLLTGYAIFITGTLLVPKLLLKKEVEEGLEKYAKETVRKTLDEHFLKRINDTKNELYRTDAQLSRMVAFQLHEQYPVWSVGWAYRSLKRYKNLDSTKIGFLEYRDFIQFLKKGVIAFSIDKFHNEVNEEFQLKYQANIDSKKELPLDSAWRVLKNEAESAKEENLRPALRAVKDISDFEYAVRFDKSDKIGETEIGILQDIAKCAGLFARKVCVVILWDISRDKSDSSQAENTYAVERLMQDLLKISNYGEKGGFKQEIRQKFQKKLKQTLQQIEKDIKTSPYNYYNTSTSPDSGYFFADEGTKPLVIKE